MADTTSGPPEGGFYGRPGVITHGQYYIASERQVADGGRRAVDAAALRPAQRPRPARPAVRLRPRPVRRLHRASSRARRCARASRPVSTVQGAEITTLEGLRQDGMLHPLQQAWIDEQVPQCGFCQNGQILTAKALLDRNPNPTDAQIRQGMAGDAVPLHDVLPHPGRHQARGEGDGLRAAGIGQRGDRMTTHAATSSRPPACSSSASARARPTPTRAGGSVERAGRRARIPTPTSGSSIRGSSSARTTPRRSTSARPICGQGTGTAFRQIMSDELDIAYDKTSCVMGSTDVTVDQGGSGGSDALQTDGWPMRRVAAEARRVLLEMASHAARRAGRSARASATA